MVRTKQYYRTKIILRILQLLLTLYHNIVKEYWIIYQTYQEKWAVEIAGRATEAF